MRITAGELKGRALPPLKDKSVRPTSSKTREALFNILQSEAGSVEGFKVLDLFAGTGLIGFEAISRGAASAVEVDVSGALLQVIKETAEKWGIANKIKTQKRDALSLAHSETLNSPAAFSAAEKTTYDLIYADPPFSEVYPDLRVFLNMISAGGFAVFEMPSRRLPEWAQEAKKLRSYGESTLAFFSNS